LVIANLLKRGIESAIEAIETGIGARGVDVEVFGFKGRPEGEVDPSRFDAIISIGGDGTVLFASRFVIPHPIPIFPVNLGRLGFLAELTTDTLFTCFDSYVQGEISASNRFMLEISLLREGRTVATYHGLNDGVITGAGIANIVNLEFSVDGDSFGAFQADGLIVSTPTGSTAYSLAAGGPVLYPDLRAIVINPICAFNLTNRPMVVGEDAIVDVSLDFEQRSSIALTVDGQEYEELREGDVVRFKRSPHVARLVYSDGYAFHTVLRNKMNWAGGPGT
jgi:NAD+ kinase